MPPRPAGRGRSNNLSSAGSAAPATFAVNTDNINYNNNENNNENNSNNFSSSNENNNNNFISSNENNNNNFISSNENNNINDNNNDNIDSNSSHATPYPPPPAASNIALNNSTTIVRGGGTLVVETVDAAEYLAMQAKHKSYTKEIKEATPPRGSSNRSQYMNISGGGDEYYDRDRDHDQVVDGGAIYNGPSYEGSSRSSSHHHHWDGRREDRNCSLPYPLNGYGASTASAVGDNNNNSTTTNNNDNNTTTYNNDYSSAGHTSGRISNNSNRNHSSDYNATATVTAATTTNGNIYSEDNYIISSSSSSNAHDVRPNSAPGHYMELNVGQNNGIGINVEYNAGSADTDGTFELGDLLWVQLDQRNDGNPCWPACVVDRSFLPTTEGYSSSVSTATSATSLLGGVTKRKELVVFVYGLLVFDICRCSGRGILAFDSGIADELESRVGDTMRSMFKRAVSQVVNAALMMPKESRLDAIRNNIYSVSSRSRSRSRSNGYSNQGTHPLETLFVDQFNRCCQLVNQRQLQAARDIAYNLKEMLPLIKGVACIDVSKYHAELDSFVQGVEGDLSLTLSSAGASGANAASVSQISIIATTTTTATASSMADKDSDWDRGGIMANNQHHQEQQYQQEHQQQHQQEHQHPSGKVEDSDLLETSAFNDDANYFEKEKEEEEEEEEDDDDDDEDDDEDDEEEVEEVEGNRADDVNYVVSNVVSDVADENKTSYEDNHVELRNYLELLGQEEGIESEGRTIEVVRQLRSVIKLRDESLTLLVISAIIDLISSKESDKERAATMKVRLGTAECCELLTDAMILYRGSHDVTLKVCKAISILAHSNSNNSSKLGGCCEPLTRALESSFADVVVSACKAIYNLSYNNNGFSHDGMDNRIVFVKSGCCEQLVRILTTVDDDKVLCNACKVVHILLDRKDKFIELGCVEALNRVSALPGRSEALHSSADIILRILYAHMAPPPTTTAFDNNSASLANLSTITPPPLPPQTSTSTSSLTFSILAKSMSDAIPGGSPLPPPHPPNSNADDDLAPVAELADPRKNRINTNTVAVSHIHISDDGENYNFKNNDNRNDNNSNDTATTSSISVHQIASESNDATEINNNLNYNSGADGSNPNPNPTPLVINVPPPRPSASKRPPLSAAITTTHGGSGVVNKSVNLPSPSARANSSSSSSSSSSRSNKYSNIPAPAVIAVAPYQSASLGSFPTVNGDVNSSTQGTSFYSTQSGALIEKTPTTSGGVWQQQQQQQQPAEDPAVVAGYSGGEGGEGEASLQSEQSTSNAHSSNMNSSSSNSNNNRGASPPPLYSPPPTSSSSSSSSSNSSSTSVFPPTKGSALTPPSSKDSPIPPSPSPPPSSAPKAALSPAQQPAKPATSNPLQKEAGWMRWLREKIIRHTNPDANFHHVDLYANNSSAEFVNGRWMFRNPDGSLATSEADIKEMEKESQGPPILAPTPAPTPPIGLGTGNNLSAPSTGQGSGSSEVAEIDYTRPPPRSIPSSSGRNPSSSSHVEQQSSGLAAAPPTVTAFAGSAALVPPSSSTSLNGPPSNGPQFQPQTQQPTPKTSGNKYAKPTARPTAASSAVTQQAQVNTVNDPFALNKAATPSVSNPFQFASNSN